MMKNKLGGKIIREFVASTIKMYAYGKTDKKLEEKECKSTKKYKSLTFHDYKACVFDNKTIYKEKMFLENKEHKL